MSLQTRDCTGNNYCVEERGLYALTTTGKNSSIPTWKQAGGALAVFYVVHVRCDTATGTANGNIRQQSVIWLCRKCQWKIPSTLKGVVRAVSCPKLLAVNLTTLWHSRILSRHTLAILCFLSSVSVSTFCFKLLSLSDDVFLFSISLLYLLLILFMLLPARSPSEIP